MKQNFSISDNIIYYIAKNPSTPKVYHKLVQSCKYFFDKNPVLIVKRIDNDPLFGTTICSADAGECCEMNKCCVKINLAKLKFKIWLTDRINQIDFKDSVSLICSKIYRCENAWLFFLYSKLTIEEFKIWGLTFHNFVMIDTAITDDNDNAILPDKIFESIKNVKIFDYYFQNEYPPATASTVKNITKLKSLQYLQILSLHNIPEVIPVQDFADIIKDHKDTKFLFEFHSNLSNEYKNQLDMFIDTIIESKLPNRVIIYPGQNEEKHTIMESRNRN